MLEKGKINASEFQILVIIFTLGSAIILTTAPLARVAKQDAWIAAILTTLITLFFVLLFNQLATLYPSMTYVEYNEKIVGKWIGKMTALIYLFYVYHITCGQVRDMADFFTSQVLVETPIQMIIIIFVITSLIGVRLGLEVICRSAVIFFPWIIALLFLLFFFLIPEVKLENIQPIYGEGIKPIIKASYGSLGNPLQLALFLMIIPYVTDKTEMKKAFYKGQLIGGTSIIIITIFSILVLGFGITAIQLYPTFTLAKKISIGNFLDRIEIILTIVWILSLYFKMTIGFYGLSLGLAQVLGLKSYKILTYPLAFLIITFSTFMHPNSVHLHNFLKNTLTPYSLTICLFFPLLLLVIGKIRKKHSASTATKLPIR
ncbi:GerAB/ArcD/ProY family transporter [Metabacillus rhizolycopersici]|uniref:Endospore germination permease n=1 Tax=Metabacillus rhizolycopersici TaxID=2875709 RepID=A0ABS7UQR1_9BACI|nr:endospore germination permease [Metabacillus rhizolycopersici]MBZ5750652.1 endospore germination permease [Metabacillus rhizolycopersici]